MSDSNTTDSGGREFERVADALRAGMRDGTYPYKTLLPAQRDLAEEFGVSRDTVQRVLKELRSDGWIETRQGQGSRVIWVQRVHSPTSGMVTLGPILEHAFEQPEVTLDVFTLTSESLDAHIRLQVERIRAGAIHPRRIALRMLLPSESLEPPYWKTENPDENRELKERYLGLYRRYAGSLRAMLLNLRAEGLVDSVELEIRHVRLVPHFKLYLLNGTEAVLGPYKPKVRTIVLDDGEEIADVLDVVGPSAGLTHHVKDEETNSQGTMFVATWQDWFDATWSLLTGNPRV